MQSPPPLDNNHPQQFPFVLCGFLNFISLSAACQSKYVTILHRSANLVLTKPIGG